MIGNFCTYCGKELQVLFQTGRYCPNLCDKRGGPPSAPEGKRSGSLWFYADPKIMLSMTGMQPGVSVFFPQEVSDQMVELWTSPDEIEQTIPMGHRVYRVAINRVKLPKGWRNGDRGEIENGAAISS